MERDEFFNKLIYKKKIKSTNSFLKKGKWQDKTIVYTFNQTNGRGRGQKQWIGFKNKDLAISILFKPKSIIIDSVWYVAACSLALIDILEELNICNNWIKWPNDIYVGNNKLAGVLAESVWKSNKMEKLIVGIGININSDVKDLKIFDNKATSIFIQKNEKFNLNDFFYNYKKKMFKWFFMLLDDKNGVSNIRRYWFEKSDILHKKVVWENGTNLIKGQISGIDLDGCLFLNADKKTIKVNSGEIKLVK